MGNPTPCYLHVPHKTWANDPGENENYLAIERWCRDYLRRFDTNTSTRATPLLIPNKSWADSREAENYYTIERWVYQQVPSSLGKSFQGQGFTSSDLHIPNKDWAIKAGKPGGQLEAENYIAIERWAWKFIRDCLGCFALIDTITTTDADPMSTTTPDGTLLMVWDKGASGAGTVDRSTYSIPDLTLIETVTYNTTDLPGFIIALASYGTAADDGFMYWQETSGFNVNLNQVPITGAAAPATTVATFVNDYTPFYPFGAADHLGNLYVGGQDNNTSEAVLYSIDLTTYTKTLAYNAGGIGFITPQVVTADGAVWGWWQDFLTNMKLFRWNGSTLQTRDYASAESADSGLFPLNDSSVHFNDGNGHGFKVDSHMTETPDHCFDTIPFTRDYNGGTVPTYIFLDRSGTPKFNQVLR